jgi:hypothetical protein
MHADGQASIRPAAPHQQMCLVVFVADQSVLGITGAVDGSLPEAPNCSVHWMHAALSAESRCSRRDGGTVASCPMADPWCCPMFWCLDLLSVCLLAYAFVCALHATRAYGTCGIARSCLHAHMYLWRKCTGVVDGVLDVGVICCEEADLYRARRPARSSGWSCATCCGALYLSLRLPVVRPYQFPCTRC